MPILRPALAVAALSIAAACAVATPVPAPMPAASSAAGAPLAAASAACPDRKRIPPTPGRATSKSRHVVMDGDPCADPHSAPGQR